MFGPFKAAWYFTKVANLCNTELGVDLAALDRFSKGRFTATTEELRSRKASHEEAAVFCVAVALESFAETAPTEYRLAFTKAMQQKMKVDEWAVHGRISKETLNIYREALAAMRERTQA